MLNITHHQGSANQNHNQILPQRMALLKKVKKIISTGKSMKKMKGTLAFC
jgi:hypothetical protein